MCAKTVLILQDDVDLTISTSSPTHTHLYVNTVKMIAC